MSTSSYTFHDHESESGGFFTARSVERGVAITLSVESNGDIDVLVSADAAREIARLVAAAADGA